MICYVWDNFYRKYYHKVLDVFQKNIRQIKLIISLLESDNY